MSDGTSTATTACIWVDADACPKLVKEVLFKAARRTGLPMTLVANHAMPVPKLASVQLLQVPGGFDVADDEIMARVRGGDLLITADIPLAHDALQRGAQVISPRGERFTMDTIEAKRTMRDFMDTMRASGVHGGGPPPMNANDKRAFANALDRWLAKAARG